MFFLAGLFCLLPALIASGAALSQRFPRRSGNQFRYYHVTMSRLAVIASVTLGLALMAIGLLGHLP